MFLQHKAERFRNLFLVALDLFTDKFFRSGREQSKPEALLVVPVGNLNAVRDTRILMKQALTEEVAMASPHALPIAVSEDDRVTLLNWKRRRSTAQGLAL